MSSPGQPLDFQALPAAPSGSVNVTFQADAPTAPPTSVIRKISAYVTFAYDTVLYISLAGNAANQEIFRKYVAHTETYAANFAGSGGSVNASTEATGSTTYTVKKNGTAIGTIVWAASTATPTFTTTGGVAQTTSPGDILTIVGPATPDATLANWAVTLVSTRT